MRAVGNSLIRRKPGGLFPLFRPLGEFRLGHGPVSYTHLDVYKRQAQTFWRNMVQKEDGRLLRKGDGYTNGETQTYRVSFPAEVTPERMAAGRRTHAVHAGELLGIALFRAMQKLLDIRELLFEMEGHGRDRRGMRGTERTVGWFTAVSYTHLDVYKRQEQTGGLVWNQCHVCGRLYGPNRSIRPEEGLRSGRGELRLSLIHICFTAYTGRCWTD